jgi:hypothetical protein
MDRRDHPVAGAADRGLISNFIGLSPTPHPVGNNHVSAAFNAGSPKPGCDAARSPGAYLEEVDDERHIPLALHVQFLLTVFSVI